MLAIAAAWHFAELDKLDSPERVAEAARALRENPAGLLYVVLAFVAGTLLFLPVTALMLGTLLAFGALRGFGYAFLGTLLGASITYWIGRLSGGAAVDYLGGRRMARFKDELRAHAFRASIAARLLPVGNFTVINLLCGSVRIPFRSFLLGNVVGILPGLLILTFFADQIRAALQSPSKSQLALLGVAAVVLVACSIGLKVWLKRRERMPEASGEPPT